MTSQGRANRVAQRIQEELSTLLIFEVSDPRLSAVFITHVKVDRELAFANIFVSALEGAERSEEFWKASAAPPVSSAASWLNGSICAPSHSCASTGTRSRKTQTGSTN